MVLRDSEIGLIVAMEVMGGNATTEEIASFASMNQDYVRNLVARLRSEGFVESVSAAVGFGFLGDRKDLAGREKINVLARPFEDILRENEDLFLRWGRVVLRVDGKDELLSKIGELRKQRKKAAAQQ